MANKNKPLVLGIDPGTTVGISILDIEGQILSSFSRKNAKHSDIILKILEFGDPVACGTDKANPPSTVKLIAVKFGAIIVNPRVDLLKKDKKDLYELKEFRNDHEYDAACAAKFAFNKLKSRLTQAKSVLTKHPGIDEAAYYKFILKHPKLTFEQSIIKMQSKDLTKSESVIRRPRKSDDEYHRLAELYSNLKTKYVNEKKQSAHEIKRLQTKVSKMELLLSKSRQNLSSYADKRDLIKKNIDIVQKAEINKLAKTISILESKLKNLEKILVKPNSWVRVPILSMQEKNKVRSMLANIPPNHTIFIKDVMGLGENLREIITKKGLYVISSAKTKTNLRVIPSTEIKTQVIFKNNLYIQDHELEWAKKSFDLISSIVTEYRKKRANNGIKKEGGFGT